MFEKTAHLYDTIYEFVDRSSAVDMLTQVIDARSPCARTLLDVACGTGAHMEAFMPRFAAVEGLDLDERMVRLAAQKVAPFPVHVADMADFDLGRRFDVVVNLFSSIAYARTVERMEATVACMARHLAPGGVLLIEPWFPPHTYWTDRLTVNHVERGDLRVTWMYTSRREGMLSILEIHYLAGTSAGIDHFEERHELGLFTEQQYGDAVRATGLSVEHDPVGPMGRGLYIGTTA